MIDKPVEGTTSVYEKWLLPLLIWLLPVVTLALGVRTWLPPLASEHRAENKCQLNRSIRHHHMNLCL